MNSGRIWNSLRDNTLRSFIGIFLIDNKTTENPNRESYKLERSKWLELKRDANRTPPGCLPAYQVDLKEVQLFVFEVDTWDEIVKYVLALEDQLERAVEKLEEATRKTSQMSGVSEDD